ncbi:preprotein translocase subunit TatA [Branchiibius cervicis]|uniref:Preprotein translocase subunit TatA n=1 Tax=Branchiibius cervicis TaxID=908252 RepID=A0ABW2AQG4_9MICO
MSFLGIGSWDFLVLIVLAAVLIGPDRMPEYLAKFRQFVRSARDMAEGAKTQLKEQMGPEFQDVDWRQYDPRQYDPRRIVRDALGEDVSDTLGIPQTQAAVDANAHTAAVVAPVAVQAMRYDPDRATPFDLDAT